MGKGYEGTRSLGQEEILKYSEDVEKWTKLESASSKTERKPSCSRCVLAIALGLTLLLVLLLVSCLVYWVKSSLSPPDFAYVCPDAWLGFRGKCYYFSVDESDWDTSWASCKSMDASLASIDDLEELIFVKRCKGHANHWFGLRKAGNESWKWSDGTAFNNWFEVRGGGPCAYLNEERVSSSLCHTQKNWLCSKPDNYVLWRGKI